MKYRRSSVPQPTLTVCQCPIINDDQARAGPGASPSTPTIARVPAEVPTGPWQKYPRAYTSAAEVPTIDRVPAETLSTYDRAELTACQQKYLIISRNTTCGNSRPYTRFITCRRQRRIRHRRVYRPNHRQFCDYRSYRSTLALTNTVVAPAT